jgi:hypothetical protein
MRITWLFLLILLSGCVTGFDPVAWEEYQRIQKEMNISTELMQRTGQLHDVKLKSSKDDSYDQLLIQLRAMQHNKTN